MDAWLSAAAALSVLYPPVVAAATLGRLRALVDAWRPSASGRVTRGPLTSGDCLAIAYPDHIQAPDEPPLVTLGRFIDRYLGDIVTGVHVLPFFPWSSDEGFAVTDFHAVAPAYGDWATVAALSGRYRLMVDLVLNHASVQGSWFQRFAAGDPAFAHRFVTIIGDPDLAAVVRPRTSALWTELSTASGPRRVWTTFGPDQADLDYRDAGTLLAMVEVLLAYVGWGANLVRLDAVAFLWKEPGTSCLHLPQTHAVVRVLRAVLDVAAPDVLLVTETNVPHAENRSYFGDGADEAQLVYNFALPPLVLHTLLTGDASRLAHWAADLAAPSDRATYLNFLASHDGIGLNPVREILTEDQVARLVERAVAAGGQVSLRSAASGSQPYELNVNYLDALIDGPTAQAEATGVARFLCAHAIALSLVGVPLLYLHSLLGSRGWPAGVAAGGPPRAVNRERLRLADVASDLSRPTSRRARLRSALAELAVARRTMPAFDPYGRQDVLDLGPACFALRRQARAGGAAVVCVHNVSNEPVVVALDSAALHGAPPLVARGLRATAPDRLDLAPYGYAWWMDDD
jgi:glucosylglycerate phosphorylase